MLLLLPVLPLPSGAGAIPCGCHMHSPIGVL